MVIFVITTQGRAKRPLGMTGRSTSVGCKKAKKVKSLVYVEQSAEKIHFERTT